jgi:hypothetical protein
MSEHPFLELNLWIRFYKNEKGKCPLSADGKSRFYSLDESKLRPIQRNIAEPQFEGVTVFMSKI